MSAAYLVLYEGRPPDPDAFLGYYVERHVPLLWEFPGIRDVQLFVGRAEGDFFLITRLLFENLHTLEQAITSPERGHARADMANFPPFEGKVRWQITEVLEPDRP